MKTKYLIYAILPLMGACSSTESPLIDGEASEALPITLSYTLSAPSRAAFGLDTNLYGGISVPVLIEDATTKEQVFLGEYFVNTDGSLMLHSTYEQPLFPASGNSVNIYAFAGLLDTGVFSSTGYTLISMSALLNEDAYAENDICFAKLENVSPTTSTLILPFKHVMSKVEVTINVDESVKSTVSQLMICSAFNVGLQLGTNGNPSIFYSSVEYIMNGMCCDVDEVNEAIISPRTYPENQLFLTVTLSDDTFFSYYLPEDTEFESGKKYCFNVTIKANELAVSHSVKDWNDGGETNITLTY